MEAILVILAFGLCLSLAGLVISLFVMPDYPPISKPKISKRTTEKCIAQCERIICDDQMKEAEQLINKYSPNKKWEKVFGIKLPLVRLWLKQGKLTRILDCVKACLRNQIIVDFGCRPYPEDLLCYLRSAYIQHAEAYGWFPDLDVICEISREYFQYSSSREVVRLQNSTHDYIAIARKKDTTAEEPSIMLLTRLEANAVLLSVYQPCPDRLE